MTATKIRKLTENDQVDELARLLGGAEITEKVRENAEEMKRLAGETKSRLNADAEAQSLRMDPAVQILQKQIFQVIFRLFQRQIPPCFRQRMNR